MDRSRRHCKHGSRNGTGVGYHGVWSSWHTRLVRRGATPYAVPERSPDLGEKPLAEDRGLGAHWLSHRGRERQVPGMAGCGGESAQTQRPAWAQLDGIPTTVQGCSLATIDAGMQASRTSRCPSIRRTWLWCWYLVLADPAMHASCGLIIGHPASLRSNGGRLRLKEVTTLPWTEWQASRGLSGRNPWNTHLCDGATPSTQPHKPSQDDCRVPRNA
jgi:hypothetical protein